MSHELRVEDGVVLEEYHEDHVEPLWAMIQDNPDFRICMPWTKRMDGPATVAEALQLFKAGRARGVLVGYLINCNGQLAGGVDAFMLDPALSKYVEIGYFLGENYRGLGLAMASVLAVEEEITLHNPNVDLALCIDDTNVDSQATARRLGYSATVMFDTDGSRVWDRNNG